MRNTLHVLADDLADDAPWRTETAADVEAYLRKVVAFQAYLEQTIAEDNP